MSNLRDLIATTFVLIFLMSPLHTGIDADIDGPQQGVELVMMEIEEDSISIDISFNGTSTGQIQCRATLLYDLGLLIEYVDLYIEPEFPDYISVVLEDYEVRLTPESPVYDFTANISVDPKTSSTLNPSVIMGGTARTNRGTDGEVRTDSTEVEILPYYSATIFFSDPTGDMDTGSTDTFPMTIQNTGNAGEHFILSVTNSEFLSSKGIEVTFQDSRVYVEEDGEEEVEVKVKAGKDTDRGSYIVQIAVWSERNGHPTEEDTEASLTLNIDNPYIDVIERFVRDPIYLWAGLAILVVVLGLGIWGAIKLREHLLWKRTMRNIRKAGLQEASVHAEEEVEIQQDP
ncbi:MAG: choice-of-anchor T family protein [Thermoplasmatota archaeon]